MTDLQLSRRETIGALAATSGPAPIRQSNSALRRRPPPMRRPARCSTRSPKTSFVFHPRSATIARPRHGRARRAPLAAERPFGRPVSGGSRRRFAPISRAPKRSTTAASAFPTRTSVEVVRSAYRTALEGFALPYGDVAVGGWRNTPYVVIQNVGAYLDTPQLPRCRPSDRKRRRRRGLSRAASRSIPRQLDGELGRVMRAAAQGLVAPDFLSTRRSTSSRIAREGRARRRRPRRIPRSPDQGKGHRRQLGRPRAQRSPRSEVAPALDRQIAELRPQRAVATNDAGMWARPHGDEYYRWALKAPTTTDDDARTRSTRWASSSCRALHGADGPDPQEPRLHARAQSARA